jgi:hypothetical protein
MRRIGLRTRRRRVPAIGLALMSAVAVLGLAVLVSSLLDPKAAPAVPAVPARDLGLWADIRWERTDPPAMGGNLNQSLSQIVQGGPGLAVLGTDADGDAGAQRSMAAVWTSPDGRDWAKARLLDGVAKGDTSEAFVIAAMPGALVVSGGVCCTVEEHRAMWWSDDGRDWERLVLPPEMLGVSFLSIAGGPQGFVGVGVSHVGNPNDPAEIGEMWTSPNGRVWEEVDPDAAGIGPGAVSGVAWTGSHWLAVGKQAGGDTWDGAVWRSPDLHGWSRVAAADRDLIGADEVELYGVAPFAGGILAMGGRGTHDDRVRCEEALGVAGLPDAVLVLSCGWLVNEHLWSGDGVDWRRLPPIEARLGGEALPPGPNGRRLISHRVIAAGGPGLVVVDAEQPRPGQEPAGDIVGTWISIDGDDWRPVGRAPQLPIGLYLNDVVVSGRRVVGIGDSEWEQPTGPDGVVWLGTILP